jgi:plasmid maintenance system antidote protein VapI
MNSHSITPMSSNQVAAAIRDGINGITNAVAAEKTGISQQYFSDIVHGRRQLSPRVAVRLHLLGIDGNALYLSKAVYDLAVARSEMDDND